MIYLSQNTKSIINNFSKINPSLYFSEGNVIKTISPLKTVFAKATIGESFPKSFGIYDLSKFLSALSLFKEPDLEFNDDHLLISENDIKIRYVYAGRNTILSPSEDKEPKFSSENEIASFELSNELIKTVNKALNVLSLNTVLIEGKDGDLIIRGENIEDIKSSNSDNYTVKLGKTENQFSVAYKADVFNLLYSDNYKVGIMKGKTSYMSWFNGTNIDYYLICDAGR